MEEEKYLLKWNEFESNLSEGLRTCRLDHNFCDVTLACEEDQLQAHKVILTASSNFFKKILTSNIHQHTILYLKGVKMRDLESIINYIYHGETNVALGDLDSFLEVATEFQIKGLTSPPGKESLTEHPRKKYAFESSDAGKLSYTSSSSKASNEEHKDSTIKVKKEKEYEVQVIEEPVYANEYDNRTTEFDINVSGDIPYDYPQEGVNYSVDLNRSFAAGSNDQNAATEVKRLTDQYLQRIELDGNILWSCTHCGKQGKQKHHVREHIESNHIDCLTFTCPYCNKEMKNRVALRSHISKNHRAENMRSKGLYY